MEDVLAEKIIKLALAILVIAAALAFWLLPKTKIARKFKMSEALFMLTNIIGMICGAAGLLVTFAWSGLIVEYHLWEIILMPFVLIYVYWGIIMRTGKSLAILDEKQSLNMASAAAMTWSISIPAMAFLFILYYQNILQGMLWFPYYFFVTLLIFSASTLFYFKKA
jgi:hypothetical protein